LTPVFWKLDSVVGTPLEYIVLYNPFYYFIEIFRSIVLASPLNQDMLNTVGLITLVNLFLGISVFTYFRNQIPRLVKV
jgi:ABC-type polysaccharide/polyol phosphate export permease